MKTLTACLFGILLVTSCVSPSPPAQTESPPLPTAAETIARQSAASLSPVGALQPSAGALICSFSADSLTFWAQDLFNAGLYDAETLALLAEFKGGEASAIYDLSPDGRTLAYSLDGREIRLFDVFAQKDRLTYTPDFAFSNAFFNSTGTLLGIQSLDEIAIIHINTEDGRPGGILSGFSTAAPVYSARYSPDGATLLWWSRGTVQPMAIVTGEMGPRLSHEDFVAALAMPSSGGSIATAAAGTLDGEFQPLVALWDAKSGEILWQRGNPSYFSSLDFTPDGDLLAAGTQGEIVIYDTSSGDELLRLKTGAEVVNSLDFSPDGRALLTCETDGKLTLWKAD